MLYFNKIKFKHVLYFICLFFYGCDDSKLNEINNLKQDITRLQQKLESKSREINELNQNKMQLKEELEKNYKKNEICEIELKDTKVHLATLDAQLTQANKIVETDKEQLRLAYEAKFSIDLIDKFKVREEELKEDLNKTQNKFENDIFVKFVFILFLLIIIFFLFYLHLRKDFSYKEDKLNYEFENKKKELDMEITAVKDKQTAILSDIYAKNIYGRKLHEVISILNIELNKTIDN